MTGFKMPGTLSIPAERRRTIYHSHSFAIRPKRRATVQTQTNGLIIKTRDINENDTVVKVLTGELGLISAFTNGTKKVKSRTASAAVSSMTYSQLTLYRGRESYIIDDAKAIDIFFGLRDDIEKLSLANYFCELAGEFSPENTEAHEFLSLTLNLLHLLSEGKRTAEFLKPVGELRMLTLAGYMPDLSGCAQCQNELPDEPVFCPERAEFFCRNCVPQGEGIPVTPGVINAMRHICTCDMRALFSFRMPDSSLKLLSEVSERYLLLQLGHKLRTLDFYNSVKS